MVVAQQPADAVSPMDLCTRVYRFWRSFQQLVVEPLVVPLAMVVLDVLPNDEAQVTLAKHHDSVEALTRARDS
jgi:hypothetical protein